jgi:hypothetical protein
MHAIQRALILMFVVLPAMIVTGCSFVQMGYSQIDRLIAWRLDDYLPMYSAQRATVEPAVARLVDWHCATQLPVYVAWLRTVDADARAGLSAERAATHIDQALLLAHEVVREAAREIGPLVAGASPAQIKALTARLKKNNLEYVEEWVTPSRDELVRERTARLTRRIEAWTGSLTPQQEVLVANWARDIRSNGEDGLESRRKWQAALTGLLSRSSPDRTELVAGLEALFITPERVWTPGYAAAFRANRSRAAEALAALSASLTPPQRQHLQREVAALAGDFEQIACRRGDYSTQARS